LLALVCATIGFVQSRFSLFKCFLLGGGFADSIAVCIVFLSFLLGLLIILLGLLLLCGCLLAFSFGFVFEFLGLVAKRCDRVF
jgi:hypothetical protein